MDKFKIKDIIPAEPAVIYAAWLDSKEHAAMTGNKAKVSSRVGEKFTAWDDYISGENLELEPGKKIVQSWRTTEFPDGAPDSKLIITFKEVKGGTEVTLEHTGIPEGQTEEYMEGWKDYYFAPMKEYFAGK
jgi:activator of HSP90 ATPase